MAYRFNPPPNWPIDDAGWTPPPGWQPDPSWGPAPEGWNFWVDADEAAAAPAEQSAPEGPSQSDPVVADDATHVASTGEQTDAGPVVEDDATRVVSTDQRQSEDSTPDASPAQTDDAPSDQQGEPYGRHEAVPAAGDQMPSAPAYGDQATSAPADGQRVDDDATHVAGTDQRDELGSSTEDGGAGESTGGSETAEYGGPDLDADLAQQAPYESASPIPSDGSGAPEGSPDQSAQGQDQGYGTAAAAGAAAAGATAAGAAGAQGAAQSGQQGYGQASPNQGYGQASPAQGYGQPSPNQGYGQGSPAQGYGQGSPATGYGQGSAPDYPAPGFSQGSPGGIDSGSGWTASTQAGEAPKKGFLQRFWWVGCIIAALLVLALIAVGSIILLNRGGDDAAGGGDGQTTQEQTTDQEATEEEPTEAEPTPTDLATIDPSAEAVDIVGTDGTGTMAVHMAWVPASELVDSWDGGPMDEGEYGDYLLLTAKLTVTEGTFEDINPHQFSIKTPYGGEVSPSPQSYGLAGSGLDFVPVNGFQAGEEYTIQVLYEVQRAGGNTMNFTTYVDDYSWEVPA